MTRDRETRELIRLAEEQGPSPLLKAMLGLSDDLHRGRRRELWFRLFVVAVIAALLYLGVSNRQTTNDIVSTRAQSRKGLCAAIQAQTDALAKATSADVSTLTAYVADLNGGLSAIDCVITVHPSRG